MKASHAIWKERFKGQLPEPLGSEVDQFETEIRIAALPCQSVPESQHVPSS